MELDVIRAKIMFCLDKLYSNDGVLLSRNNGNGLCERCLLFRFALYLQEQFNNYFVDCDFNSSNIGGSERSGKPITSLNGQSSTKRFIDIIVHKRTFNSEDNFICFEVKKWNNYTSDDLTKDKNNLKVLTSKYGYKYGFLLIFGKQKIQTKWSMWSNGSKFINNELVFQDEKKQIQTN